MSVEIISDEKLIISPMNVRVGEIFDPMDEENDRLIKNIRSQGIIEDLVVRPFGDKFEVVVGRRRFLAGKTAGLKEFPCKVKEMSDAEALTASLSEAITHEEVDPVTRARALKKLMDISRKTMMAIGRELGIPKSTLSEWISLLQLSERLQEKVATGDVPLRDALEVVRLRIPKESHDVLAESAEKGIDFFKREVLRLAEERPKRGAPPGLLVVRLVLDKDVYDELCHRADMEGKEVGEYCKSVLITHVKA